MKKTLFFIISSVLGITLLAGVVYKVGWDSIVHAVGSFSILELSIVVGLAFVQQSVTVWRWHLILKSQGYDLSYIRLFAAKLVGFAMDYTTPTPNVGGEAIRAYVVKKDSGVNFSTGLASVIIDKVMDFSYALPFVIAGVAYALLRFDLTASYVLFLVLVAIAFVFLMIFFYARTLSQKRFFSTIMRFFQLHRVGFMARLIEKMRTFEDMIIDFFRDHRKVFYIGLGFSLLSGVIAIFQYYLILRFFDLEVTLFTVLVVVTLTILTYLLPIPGSLGSQEAGLALIFSFLGLGAQTGIAFSFVIRVPEVIKVAVGYGYLSHFGIRLTKKMLAKTSEESGQESVRREEPRP